MLVLKHVEHEIADVAQLKDLLTHLRETTSQIAGITFKDIYFMKDEKEFILFLECDSEKSYHEWREICPPPPGANDWYEVLLTKNEQFPE
jgi:hypothetical protein